MIVAGNGEEALTVYDGHRGKMELLISDVIRPGMGGRELRDALLAKQKKMKVRFMSGYTDAAVVRYGVNESKVPFIQKPFTPEGFAPKVREVWTDPGASFHRKKAPPNMRCFLLNGKRSICACM